MKLESPNLPADLSEAFDLPDEDEFESLLINSADLSWQDLHGREFRSCIFRKTPLHDADLRRAAFVDVIFDHCDLSACKLEDAVFQRVKFIGCRMTGADLIHAVLRNTAFEDCRMDYVNLARSKTEWTAFSSCTMREAALTECTLKKTTVFDNCDLTRATIHMTPMAGLDLRTCQLDGVTIGLNDVRGMIVTSLQAVSLCALLGLVIKE